MEFISEFLKTHLSPYVPMEYIELYLAFLKQLPGYLMIIMPCMGHILQIRKMQAAKSTVGFSTLISFILVTGNVIRIFWWYVDRFSLIILNAAILMFLCQMTLIY